MLSTGYIPSLNHAVPPFPFACLGPYSHKKGDKPKDIAIGHLVRDLKIHQDIQSPVVFHGNLSWDQQTLV